MAPKLSPLTQLVVVVMGVSGAGKTTITAMLARTLGWMYFEGDGYLPSPDFARAMRGEPLSDEVVVDMLAKIRRIIEKYLAKKQNAVIACTALTAAHRQELQVSDRVRFVYLRGPYDLLVERQVGRKSKLPHLERLAYQWKIFEVPQDALAVEISLTPREIVETICRDLSKLKNNLECCWGGCAAPATLNKSLYEP